VISRKRTIAPSVWNDEFRVSQAEIKDALRKVRGNRKVPGPDGTSGWCIWGILGNLVLLFHGVLKRWRLSDFMEGIQVGTTDEKQRWGS